MNYSNGRYNVSLHRLLLVLRRTLRRFYMVFVVPRMAMGTIHRMQESGRKKRDFVVPSAWQNSGTVVPQCVFQYCVTITRYISGCFLYTHKRNAPARPRPRYSCTQAANKHIDFVPQMQPTPRLSTPSGLHGL